MHPYWFNVVDVINSTLQHLPQSMSWTHIVLDPSLSISFHREAGSLLGSRIRVEICDGMVSRDPKICQKMTVYIERNFIDPLIPKDRTIGAQLQRDLVPLLADLPRPTEVR